MKILISGGTGLVGKELGKTLVQRGHDVYVLTRDTENSKIATPYPHTPVYWDATKNSPPSDIISEMDGIINLAGAGVADRRWTDNYKNSIFNSRVIGTQNLVRAVNEHGKKVQFFISTSAVGYYGETGDEPVKEDENPTFTFLGKLCVAWESPIFNFLREDIRKAVLRVGVVFSEKGGALQKMSEPIQSGMGGVLGTGLQEISWIDIDDLVNMYIFAIENPLEGAFNAVAPTRISNRQLTEIIATKMKRKQGPSVPKFAVKLAVGEMADVLFENQVISAEKIQSAGFQFQWTQAKDSVESRLNYREPTENRHIFEQWLPCKPIELFPFFSDAENLSKLTPPSLNLKLVQKSSESMNKDVMLEYKIKFCGIPLSWISRINEWNPHHSFVDEQTFGPYKKWIHMHKFQDLAGGTLITDQVDAIMPLGRLGKWTAGFKVNKDVNEIFKYRRKAIAELYGNASK